MKKQNWVAQKKSWKAMTGQNARATPKSQNLAEYADISS
jgi:hypothetical protein